MPGFRLRGRKNTSGGGDDGGGGGSRMEERLRTARILASDDEEDEEHVARRRRTRTQIERDLNNPKVHKRIVENLYFAYKMRVRRRRRRRRRLAFSLEFFVAENKTFPKAFDVLSRSLGCWV